MRSFVPLADRTFIVRKGRFYDSFTVMLLCTTRLVRGFLYTQKETPKDFSFKVSQNIVFYTSVKKRSAKLQTNYSHSIVAGGLEVISYTMRLMPLTSLTIRLDALSRTSYGILAQSAVIKSVVVTPRSASV